jgi:hypothetical protein
MILKREGLITIRRLSPHIGGRRKTKLRLLRKRRERTQRLEFLLLN